MSVVYALCDPDRLEVRYVGKTERLPAIRLRNHLSDAKRGRTIVANWIRKVGSPVMVALEVDPPDLNEAERKWIADLRAQGARLANMTDGGTGGNTMGGRRHTEATLEKMRVAQKGKKPPPMSAEGRAKWTAAMKGRPISAEHRAAISRGHMGIPAHNRGKRVSDEVRQKIARSQRESWQKRLSR